MKPPTCSVIKNSDLDPDPGKNIKKGQIKLKTEPYLKKPYSFISLNAPDSKHKPYRAVRSPNIARNSLKRYVIVCILYIYYIQYIELC